jgi:hypothetical protein
VLTVIAVIAVSPQSRYDAANQSFEINPGSGALMKSFSKLTPARYQRHGVAASFGSTPAVASRA